MYRKMELFQKEIESDSSILASVESSVNVLFLNYPAWLQLCSLDSKYSVGEYSMIFKDMNCLVNDYLLPGKPFKLYWFYSFQVCLASIAFQLNKYAYQQNSNLSIAIHHLEKTFMYLTNQYYQKFLLESS